MNIEALHKSEQAVSAKLLFQGKEGKLLAIHIMEGQRLKEHITQTPALLLCVTGSTVYEDEKGRRETLGPGDYVNIKPMVSHWLDALTDSHLMLGK